MAGGPAETSAGHRVPKPQPGSAAAPRRPAGSLGPRTLVTERGGWPRVPSSHLPGESLPPSRAVWVFETFDVKRGATREGSVLVPFFAFDKQQLPAAFARSRQAPTAKPGKHGRAPSPGIPLPVENKEWARFLLGSAAGSEGEGGDVGHTQHGRPVYAVTALRLRRNPAGAAGGAWLQRGKPRRGKGLV